MTSASPTPDILEFSSDEPNALGPNLSLVDAIEVVIDSLDSGDTALVSHGKTGHLWKFQYGSVQVFVQLTGSSGDSGTSQSLCVYLRPLEHYLCYR